MAFSGAVFLGDIVHSFSNFKNALFHLRGPDWFAVFFCVFGVFYGMRKGMIREAIEIGEMMLIIYLTFLFQEFTLGIIADSLMIAPERIAPVVFVLGAWLIWMTVAFINKLFTPYFESKVPGPIKTVGGAVFGAVHFFLIWCFISQAVLLIPSQKVKDVYADDKSVTGPTARDLPRDVHDTLSNFLKIPAAEEKK